MKLSSVANGTSRLSGSSLRTILPSRSAGFCTVAVQPKRTDPQLQAGRLFPDPKRCADQKQSTGNDRCPGERTHAELTLKTDGLQPKITAPTTRITMEIRVL